MQYSPLVPEPIKKQISQLPPNTRVQSVLSPADLTLSQFPRFLSRELTLSVPVYTVWGSCEDVAVLEKLRARSYKVHNLHIIDEAHSRLLTVGGIKLRLFGLGGAMVMHRLFDVGEGRTSIAGGQGTMWTTVIQMGELLDTAARVYDPTETRVFVTHASPSREGLLIQLASALKADLTISAGLHFRYGSSYNEFSVSPSQSHYYQKLVGSRTNFDDVWETVESDVLEAVSGQESHQRLLNLVLDMVRSMPTANDPVSAADDGVFKITWNFNLADAAYGSLVLNVVDGRIATEMRSEGFNFGHRAAQPLPAHASQTVSTENSNHPSSKPATASRPTTVPAVSSQDSRSGQAGSTSHPSAQPGAPDVSMPTGRTAPKAQSPEGSKPLASKPPFNSSESQHTHALFVRSAKDESDVLALLADQDRAKAKVSRYGANYVVVFSTADEVKSALENISDDHKSGGSARPQAAVFRGKFNPQSNNAGGVSGGSGGGGGGSGGNAHNWDSEGEPRRGGGGMRGRGRGGRGRGKQ